MNLIHYQMGTLFEMGNLEIKNDVDYISYSKEAMN